MKNFTSMDSVLFQMLEEDVENYVKEFNSWNFDTKIWHEENTPYPVSKLITTAVYVLGWRYNEETRKYERKEDYS